MRFVLSIGVLALHATTLIVARDPSSIVFPDEDAPAAFERRALEATTESMNEFSRKFYQAVAKKNSGNLICSPLSAGLIMSMVSYGAAGKTNDQMRDALKLPKDDGLARIGFRSLVDNIADYEAKNLKVANKVYVDRSVRPKSEFMRIVRTVFSSEVESIDMSGSLAASSIVNGWCEIETNHRIKDMVGPDDFNGDVLALLLNAVYFKGTWLTRFDRESTAKRPFFVSDDEKTLVPSMFVSGEFRFGNLPEVASRFIELPYKSEDNKHNVSMFVIVPYSRDGLAKLEENFHKVEVKNLIGRGEMVQTIVILPKFKIESKIDLVEPLKSMGMKRAFDEPDFSEFVDNRHLRIDKILQKAFVEVDEVGSEAAAVTEDEFADRIGPMSFAADHPFVAVIATTSGTPLTLFTARYTGPR